MKVILPKIIATVICILFVLFLSKDYASARTVSLPSISRGVGVSATVGSYYLNLSGSIAPYASVILTSNNIVLRSTVADSNGYWFISQILINPGFSNFCLDAIDYKRLGESYTCISIPPAVGNITKDNIFLPPTLGLQKKTVNQGSEATAWGYTMRGGTVTLHLSDGRVITIQADKEGFYSFQVPVPTAGTYELFADAVFNGASSLKPDKKTTLIVLSLPQQIINKGGQSLNNIGRFLIGTPWGFIWLIIPILILIIILLKKLHPEWFTWLDGGWDGVSAHIPFIHRKLHHWWMKGVGY